MTPVVLILAAVVAAELAPSAGRLPLPPRAREADAVPFTCPEKTERRGATPPEGFEVWCETPGEVPERRREGPSRTWYDDGGLAKLASFKAGKLDGMFVEWHRNGKPARAGAFEGGERDGPWTVWYESGRGEESSGYLRGRQHGPLQTWWPSGKPKVRGQYCHGLQCGTWTTWDEQGRELGKMQYEEIRSTP